MSTKQVACILGIVLGYAGLALGQTGDNCASPFSITALPFDTTGDTCGQTDDYDATCPFDAPDSPDVVYEFAPEDDITVDISLCNAATVYDTKLYVYAGACSGTPIYCNDDFDDCAFDPFYSALPSIVLSGGTTYFIVIDGYGGDCGVFQLTVTEAGGAVTPPNDQCQGLTPLPLLPETPLTFNGNNAGATSTNDCEAFEQYPNVWEGFTTTECLDVTLDYCGTGPGFTAWEVLSIGCDSECEFIAADSSDDTLCGDGNLTMQWSNLPPGEYWYPVAADPLGTPGPYTLHVVGQPCAATGEACGDAWEIPALPFDTTDNTCGRVDNYDATCPFEAPNSPDVVFAYTPTADITVDISLCNAATAYDTKLYVYADDCSGTPVYCNDDFDDCAFDPLYSALLGVTLTQDTTYFLVIDGYGGDCGDFQLTVVESQPPETPPNDQCQGVTPVALSPNTPLTFTGDNTGATSTNDCVAFEQYPNVWEGFTTTEWLDVTLDYCGTTPGFTAWQALAVGCNPDCAFVVADSWDTTTCDDDGNLISVLARRSSLSPRGRGPGRG